MFRNFRRKLLVGTVVLVAVGIPTWGYMNYVSVRPNVSWFPFETIETIKYDEGITVEGYRTLHTMASLGEILLEKPGGYMANDVTPPWAMMDDMPKWEYGVLTMLREAAIANRRYFTRSQAQSQEDADAALAMTNFNVDNGSWIFPAVDNDWLIWDGTYQTAVDHLRNQISRLTDDDPRDGKFYPRADNLSQALIAFNSHLGDYSQKLSAAIGKEDLHFAGDLELDDTSSTRTSYWKIDDNFWEAMGGVYALTEMLKAMEHDFRDVLEDKNALVPMKQVIRELEAAQRPVMSPMILNGSGYGVTANHSLILASYISRASAAMTDLNQLLRDG